LFMNITEEFDRLDKLIVGRSIDIAAMRNILHSIQEQVAAQPKESEGHVAADSCPFCHQKTGVLLEFKQSPVADSGVLGYEQGYYKCSNPNCGKTWDMKMPRN